MEIPRRLGSPPEGPPSFDSGDADGGAFDYGRRAAASAQEAGAVASAPRAAAPMLLWGGRPCRNRAILTTSPSVPLLCPHRFTRGMRTEGMAGGSPALRFGGRFATVFPLSPSPMYLRGRTPYRSRVLGSASCVP